MSGYTKKTKKPKKHDCSLSKVLRNKCHPTVYMDSGFDAEFVSQLEKTFASAYAYWQRTPFKAFKRKYLGNYTY